MKTSSYQAIPRNPVAGALSKAIATLAGRVLQGALNGKGRRFAIVVSRFNLTVTQRLLLGALDGLCRCGVRKQDIQIIWTPGAFEIPQAARQIGLKSPRGKKPDAIVCLGAVIRGETPHFEYICQEAASGIRQVALDTGIPISFGVLTVDTMRQALARAGGAKGNKGWDAAMTAVEMVSLFRRLAGR